MARPEKVGHDYFSFYTNPEKREEFGIIFSQKGTEGYVTILELECLIRGDYGEGYYVKGNDATLSKLQDRTKCVTMNKIKEILEYAVKIDYFDKKLFLKHKIITNKRIQFDHVYNSQRRNNLMIKKDYMLLTDEDLYIGGIKRKLTLEKGYFQWVNVSNNSINVDINSINVSNNSVNVSEKCNNKIKENKIKENESKLNEIKLDKIDSESNGNSVSNSESEIEFSSLHVVVQQLILENFLNIGKDPLYIYELNDFCFELNQKEGYAVKKIRKAGLAVIRTMKEKRDNPTPYDKPIGDICSYFKQGLCNVLNRKEVDYSMNDEELSDEADEIKNNDGYKIAYELGKSHAEEQELLNEADELEKLKAQRRKRKEGASNG